jgi:CRISPR system Cascade subunit CasB
MNQQTQHPFIAYLYSLAKNEDRGALAALRRGLGQPPGAAPTMFRYIIPYLPENADRFTEAAYYQVASLYALHSKSTEAGNLGAHLRQAVDANNSDALERRFTALLVSHPDDLPNYLRQTISYLKSKEIPVNWQQLLYDLQAWDYPERRVRVHKAWAGAFWGRRIEPENV